MFHQIIASGSLVDRPVKRMVWTLLFPTVYLTWVRATPLHHAHNMGFCPVMEIQSRNGTKTKDLFNQPFINGGDQEY